MSDLLRTVRRVSTVETALVVALIAATSGIVVGFLNARSARVVARQQAVQAEIALLHRIQEALIELGEKCNTYSFEYLDPGFFEDDNKTQRRALRGELLRVHGTVYYLAHALPHGSTVRTAVLEAASAAIQLQDHDRMPRAVDRRWGKDSAALRHAAEAVGRAVRDEYGRLDEVARNRQIMKLKRLVAAATSTLRRRRQPTVEQTTEQNPTA